ncbi:MAG TPA: hypothetical protein VIH90_02550 [Candidatus Saccharimonadales bacterium]
MQDSSFSHNGYPSRPFNDLSRVEHAILRREQGAVQAELFAEHTQFAGEVAITEGSGPVSVTDTELIVPETTVAGPQVELDLVFDQPDKDDPESGGALGEEFDIAERLFGAVQEGRELSGIPRGASPKAEELTGLSGIKAAGASYSRAEKK